MKMAVVLFSVSTYICTNGAQTRNEVISGTWVIVRTSQPKDFMCGPYQAIPNLQAEEKENFSQYFHFQTIILFKKKSEKGQSKTLFCHLFLSVFSSLLSQFSNSNSLWFFFLPFVTTKFWSEDPWYLLRLQSRSKKMYLRNEY